MKKLQISPEFERLTVPASKEEISRLEDSLLHNGCKAPIITWNGYIVDGHKRYRLCSYEDITYDTCELGIQDRDDVIIYLCKERLTFAKRSSPTYHYLIGKWYLSLKEKGNMMPSAVSTVASEIGLSKSTVQRDGEYALAIDMIAERDFELYQFIIMGKAAMPKKEVHKISEMDNAEFYNTKYSLMGKDTKMRNRTVRKRSTRKEMLRMPTSGNITLQTAIKEMPAYDPDMELRGLMLTIPSWIAAMKRAKQNTDTRCATAQAKELLIDALEDLEEQIYSILEVL